jgi:sigma-B regulation protein RsbU (phosphoserine phosphatase)
MTHRKREILLSLLSAIVIYWVANVVESAVIRWTHPSERALTWISDIVLAAALGVVTYLWLHLKAAQTALSQLEREKVKLDTELLLAAEIQRNLQPQLPSPTLGIKWAAHLQQAEKIGGDFYDFVQPDPDSTLLLLGDVSGKGIPAALLLASTGRLFRMLGRTKRNPAELAENLSDLLYADNRGSMFMTCLVVSLDLKRRTLTCTNAGHPPGMIIRPSGLELLDRGGTPAGMFPSSTYEWKTLELHAGDVGILVTDGISEAVAQDGIPFVEILRREIVQTPHPRSPELLCERIMRLARSKAGLDGDQEWTDDQTVLAFVVDG